MLQWKKDTEDEEEEDEESMDSEKDTDSQDEDDSDWDSDYKNPWKTLRQDVQDSLLINEVNAMRNMWTS